MATAFDHALARFISECPYIVAVHDLVTKWRVEIMDGYLLDIYFNEALGKYSYTLVRGNQRIQGWDNAPHHAEISNFPHHVHQADGKVIPSALTGNPEDDLGEVRREIERLLAR